MTRSFCWRCGEDCGRSPGWRWHYWSLSPGSAATAIARAHALLVIGVTDRRRSVGVSVYGGKRRFFEDRSRTRLRSVRESSSRPLGVFSLQYCGRFSSSDSLARNGGGEGKDSNLRHSCLCTAPKCSALDRSATSPCAALFAIYHCCRRVINIGASSGNLPMPAAIRRAFTPAAVICAGTCWRSYTSWVRSAPWP
jgi:hypothetical protein